MKSQSIRRLQPGDPIPTGEPKRYITNHGYVVLRWRGPDGYIEVHEHRLVAGMPPAHLDVHHINEVKTDNRPENLQVLTRSEHAKIAITFDPDEAIRLYTDGWSFPQLAHRYGLHPVTVMRALKRRGLTPRPRPQNKTHCDHGHAFTDENTYVWRGHRMCRTCNRRRQSEYVKRLGVESRRAYSVTRSVR